MKSRPHADADLVAHLLELLESAGEVSARRMFGGHGFFHDGLMFALVADGNFYLKTDEENRAAFEARDLPAFEVSRKGGKTLVTSYRQCPEEALDSAEKLKSWAGASMAVAKRNRRPSPGKKKGTRKR